MSTFLHIISPYNYNGAWVFDDPTVGLVKEAFVCGSDKIIEHLSRDIPDARDGFNLYFSAAPFPGHQAHLKWDREELEGNWYRLDDDGDHTPAMEGWLCPALFKYFERAPMDIYAQAAPIPTFGGS